MADPTPSPTAGAETLAGKVADALADILRSSVTSEALQAQNLLLRRLAVEGDVFSSRVPPPRNITEVGGYLNLLETLNESDIREQVLAATLGVAGPNPTPGFSPSAPVLYDEQRTNDRPAGPAQASVPVQFSMRNDFAPAFDAGLKVIHAAGCALPILSPAHGLPAAGHGIAPPADLLVFLGRTLNLMPTAALNDPDADPLAVAHVGAASLEVVARQLDATAPNAAAVTAQSWSAFKCDANACAETAASRKYLSLTPVLNAAGWYQKPAIIAPVKFSQPGAWNHWINITGLIPNVTTFGSEMSQRVTPGELAGSSLRDALTWVWDGTMFKAP